MLIDSNTMGDAGRFRTLADLERIWETVPGAPKDKGQVVLVVRKGEEGRREELKEQIVFTPEAGLPGDAWGRRAQPNLEAQITVVQRDVAELLANGQSLALFGDNLIVELDLSAGNLPPGSRVRMGGATLEVTPLPHTGCRKFRARFGEEAFQFVSKPELRDRNLRGIHMRVMAEGEVGRGDLIEVLSRAGEISAGGTRQM